MQQTSDIALWASHGREAGVVTPPTLSKRTEASLEADRVVSALGNGVKEASKASFAIPDCSRGTQSGIARDIPDVETNDWRAVCGKTASTVRREGRRKPFLPLSYWSAGKVN